MDALSPTLNENVTISWPVRYEQNISYLWDIKNITEYEFRPSEYITSSKFGTNDRVLKSDWKLRLYPNRCDESSEGIMIVLQRPESIYPFISNICKFSIVDSDQEKFQDLQFEQFDDPKMQSEHSQIYSLNMKKSS